ncbi:MAG: hypothetical protein ABR512_01030 [Desulfopila sp.]
MFFHTPNIQMTNRRQTGKEQPTVEGKAVRFLHGDTAKTIEPFIGSDTTVGMEYELQVAVEGKHTHVDLPLSIANSSYYKNVLKRSETGDISSELVEGLENFLYKNTTNVWENSWVRLPQDKLAPWTQQILAHDFLADKSDPGAGKRGDLHRFFCHHNGEQQLRLPISYLLKLALADISGGDMPRPYGDTGKKLLDNLVSDNTSPEILSFTIPRATNDSIGKLAAAETARTLLFTQLLVQYANTTFDLRDSGQKGLIYFAPHAPSRQKLLNDLVPDGYYRHLFMSPCLSGWDRGEEKHHYMGVCHRTLSRSQLNTIGKLKDAGILTNNLVTLPNTSNTCLANNGTHVSLGSRVLTSLAEDPSSGFTPDVEKYIGDLAIKIIEHFLPLFVNTYSAAPYRIDFQDFHPENVLGFLPHELDYTHLRMVWRRWKKKAKISFLGRSFTPFGPRWFDALFARVFGLRGDLVPDFRLVDYLVSLLSTETSPGLNGMMDNHFQLKEELTEMGVFDSRMSIYLLYRQRLKAASGYAGFEGRSYSLFHSLRDDMAEAVDMQNLITALAYKYILQEKIRHNDIPDTPSTESERRQIFFASAIGIPTFYIRADSDNGFLRKILEHVNSIRRSNRYRGYLRVNSNDYKLALLQVLRQDGGRLVTTSKIEDGLDALENRLRGRTPSALNKILQGVGKQLPHHRKPLNVAAHDFNATTEKYYRGELKKHHMEEGLDVLLQDCRDLAQKSDVDCRTLADLPAGIDAEEFIARHRQSIPAETADSATLRKLLHICLVVIHHQQLQN